MLCLSGFEVYSRWVPPKNAGNKRVLSSSFGIVSPPICLFQPFSCILIAKLDLSLIRISLCGFNEDSRKLILPNKKMSG